MPKKILPVMWLLFFYMMAITLAAFCPLGSGKAHLHHLDRGTSHSFICLLACASTVTEEASKFSLPSSLYFFGVPIFLSILFHSYFNHYNLHSRSPPLH
ncbi:MAG: hypothetical protein ACE5HN_05705 [Nitrospiria bacterium]